MAESRSGDERPENSVRCSGISKRQLEESERTLRIPDDDVIASRAHQLERPLRGGSGLSTWPATALTRRQRQHARLGVSDAQ